ncbi:MAG: hypothetical protein QXX15_01250, partial [Desulfurococcaceae archaeon]
MYAPFTSHFIYITYILFYSWLIPPDQIAGVLARRSAEADLAVIEGVMGLFDGYAGDDDTGSSAHIARLTATPVIIV